MIENLPFFGQLNFPAPPFDQGYPKAFLQRTDLLTDSRLTDLVELGSFAKAAAFYKISKSFQCFNLHQKKFLSKTNNLSNYEFFFLYFCNKRTVRKTSRKNRKCYPKEWQKS